ncbi:protein FAR1-RELATED SEQUENCE 6-like [Arachis stenosperma]|uniref:protein FAR1-RELATED SEQUENCE 6-like n=1 Tax=Arachis stenosperma TaxID=217475 RepID=UPI0025AD2550|nr:protein FAR1-RELATED SEQUENCE 6-like [Arachis stenosperma]
MEHNSIELSCLVPVSFNGDSFDGKSEQLDKAVECTEITESECHDTELVDELPDHSCLADGEIPRVGMRFEHLKLAQDFYATYAKKVGFISKIRATNFDRMTKQPVNQSIHCNREGFRASRVKAPIRKNTMAGVGCRARIYAKFDREKHDWVLLKVELNHSHPCSTRKAVHYHENRELTMHAKCIIEVNDEAGIRPNKTFLALANEVGGPSNLGFSEKDVRNYISSRLRSTNVNADVKEMLNYFMRMKELNPNYFYAVNINEDNKFTSAVWVDARSRASYEYYGEVVSFDTTYSTNRHGLPFAAFIGVNHHGKSTLLGCALLGSEEILSFEWVFTQWLECMGTAPKGIITDQCKSMFGAIKKVLPNTRHRWCIWHITQKIHNKLGGYSRLKELNAELKHIIWNSKSVEDFEDHWAEFIDEFNLHHNRWLSDLFEDRHMWVPIFFKGQFWASMRSTQRSEGMHSFFSGYLNCKTSLVQFVHEFDNVLGTKEPKELEDDAADSRGLIPCSTRSAIERRFQKEYTNEMFRDVQTEFGKKADCTIRAVDEQGNSARVKVEEEILVYETTRYVTFDVHFDRSTHEVRCDCNLFESAGILCCHCLVVLSSYKVNEVPSYYVLPRWSKNIKRKHTYIKSSHDVRRSNESHNMFRELCAHFYNIAQEFVDCDDEADMLHNVLEDARAKLVDYRSKMRNNTVATAHNSIVTGPSTIFGTEDIQAPSKVTTKGRPKGKRLGYELDKSIRKSMQKKRKSVRKDTRVESAANQASEASAQQIAKQGLGGFMSLLNSFDNT